LSGDKSAWGIAQNSQFPKGYLGSKQLLAQLARMSDIQLLCNWSPSCSLTLARNVSVGLKARPKIKLVAKADESPSPGGFLF